MYHSMKIITYSAKGGKKLTFDMYKDFYLVPTKLPVIAAPNIKTKTIDIPGANGSLDLTESLTPYPLYQNRTGSIEFALLMNRTEYYKQFGQLHGLNPEHAHDTSRSWAVIYSDLMNKLHGRKCRIILEDDPQWFYEGRIAISQWNSSTDGGWPTITMNYELAPHKFSVDDIGSYTYESKGGKWKWSPFSFVDGMIYQNADYAHNKPDSALNSDGMFKNIRVNNYDAYDYIGEDYITNPESSETPIHSGRLNNKITGWMPVCPEIKIQLASGTEDYIKLQLINSELGYTASNLGYMRVFSKSGTFIDPNFIFYNYADTQYQVGIVGNGTVSFSFRKASL